MKTKMMSDVEVEKFLEVGWWKKPSPWTESGSWDEDQGAVVTNDGAVAICGECGYRWYATYEVEDEEGNKTQVETPDSELTGPCPDCGYEEGIS
jgi:hypothetical protein